MDTRNAKTARIVRGELFVSTITHKFVVNRFERVELHKNTMLAVEFDTWIACRCKIATMVVRRSRLRTLQACTGMQRNNCTVLIGCGNMFDYTVMEIFEILQMSRH
eukprot:IDg11680t1